MILYGRGQSRSFRGVWALLEADIPFEYVSVNSSNLPENYLQLNPQTKVPTLVDEDAGLVLNESAAIVNYAGSLSEIELIPEQRADYDELCYFVMTELEQPLWTIGKHSFALPEEHRVEAMLSTAKFEFEKAQSALQSRFYTEAYGLGEQFTLADVLLAQTLNWAERFKMEVDENLIDYRDRMYQRPACIKGLKLIED